MAQQFSEKQLSVWTNASLVNEDITNYTVEYDGSSEKGEGYATDVIFVNVKGNKKSSGEKVQLYLALKIGKDFKIGEKNHAEFAYQREIFIYDRVFPEYRNFEQAKRSKGNFDSVPKCFKTLNAERQIIVLENLRRQGYVPYDRLIPMNVDHIKIVLKNYAKFHSISFAFQDQKPSEFENLIKNLTSAFKLWADGPFRSMFHAGAISSRDDIKEVDANLAEKINDFIQDDAATVLDKTFEQPTSELVISHGDCWSSNFLFKYENADKKCPNRVAILDWQMSSFVSPLVDVAYFLFMVSSRDQVSKFEELLEYYYENLRKNISELGSDPDKLFPHSKFREHWKIFAAVGYLLSFCFLNVILCDRSEAPDMSGCNNAEDLMTITANTKAKNKDMHLERILSLSRYYFDLLEKDVQ